MKLIVGLGNPGKGYDNTRHNIGFICLKYFAREHAIKLDKKQANAKIGRGTVEGIEVILAEPQTFMNLSGQSVSKLANYYKLKPDDIIVIHDDLDLPFGKVRIRPGRSSGGHKGINSIIQETGSRDFIHIKIGIGRPDTMNVCEEDIVNFVLTRFSSDELKQIEPSIIKVNSALLCLLTGDIKAAMNQYN